MRTPISERLPDQVDTLSGVLDHAFELYRRSFWRIAPFVALAGLPSAVMGIVFGSAQESIGKLLTGGAFSLLFSRYFWMLPLAFGIFWLTCLLYGAAMFRLGSIARGTDPGFRGSLRAAYSRHLRLFGIGMLSMIMLMVGVFCASLWAALCFGLIFGIALGTSAAPGAITVFFAAVIGLFPGFALIAYLITPSMLAPCAAMLQNLPLFESLMAGFKLQHRHFWRATLFMTVPAVVYSLCYSFAGAVMMLLVLRNIQINGPTALSTHFITQAITVPTMAVLLPMVLACTVGLYWDLYLRREGWDLQNQLRALDKSRESGTADKSRESGTADTPRESGDTHTEAPRNQLGTRSALALVLCVLGSGLEQPTYAQQLPARGAGARLEEISCPAQADKTLAEVCPELLTRLEQQGMLAPLAVDSSQPADASTVEQLRRYAELAERTNLPSDTSAEALDALIREHYRARQPVSPGLLQQLAEWWQSLFAQDSLAPGKFDFLKRWLPSKLIAQLLFYGLSTFMLGFCLLVGWRELRSFRHAQLKASVSGTDHATELWPPGGEAFNRLDPNSQIAACFRALLGSLHKNRRLIVRPEMTHQELQRWASRAVSAPGMDSRANLNTELPAAAFATLCDLAARTLFAQTNASAEQAQQYFQACAALLNANSAISGTADGQTADA